MSYFSYHCQEMYSQSVSREKGYSGSHLRVHTLVMGSPRPGAQVTAPIKEQRAVSASAQLHLTCSKSDAPDLALTLRLENFQITVRTITCVPQDLYQM